MKKIILPLLFLSVSATALPVIPELIAAKEVLTTALGIASTIAERAEAAIDPNLFTDEKFDAEMALVAIDVKHGRTEEAIVQLVELARTIYQHKDTIAPEKHRQYLKRIYRDLVVIGADHYGTLETRGDIWKRRMFYSAATVGGLSFIGLAGWLSYRHGWDARDTDPFGV